MTEPSQRPTEHLPEAAQERQATRNSRIQAARERQASRNRNAQAARQRRATRMRRILAILAGAALLSLVMDAVILVGDPSAWQFVALAATTALPLIVIFVAFRLVSQDRLDAAGYLILSGILLVLVSCQLFLSGTTLVLGVAGALLLILAGFSCLPQQRVLWLVPAGLYVAAVFAIDRFEPVPRYAIGQSDVLTTYVPFIAAFLTLAALWVLVWGFRIGTLRARLLSALVGATLLPIAIMGTGLVAVGANNEQQQVLDRLEAVAILKESQVNSWVANLKSDLILALNGEPFTRRAGDLLAADPSAPASPADPGSSGSSTSGSSQDSAIRGIVRANLDDVIRETGRFEELFLLDRKGTVVVSTDPAHEGLAYGNQLFFREGMTGLYVQRPTYSASEMQVYQFAARPFRDDQGQVRGVLAGRANLMALNGILGERAGLGGTGETYLVAAGTLLTPNRAGGRGFYVQSQGISRALDQHANGVGRYDNYQAVSVLGAYRWLPELQVALVTEQHQTEAQARISLILILLAGITLVGVAAAVLASVFLVRSIANPLASLAATAGQVADGNLNLNVEAERSDEIGALAGSFNTMTARLRELVGSLEQRVADRTRDLERRSHHLEAGAAVSRAAVSILDPAELMQRVVEEIAERFQLYYVGLFMVDEAGEWAILRANAGWAERPLPRLGQRLGVGNTSMIGWSIANARTRNAAEALADTVRVPRPELPHTRAEAALPLMSRDRVLGALTVQQTEPGAFDEDTIAVLQTMADQVAVALDNARLFVEREEALAAAHRAYGELSQEAWGRILQSGTALGYRSSERGVAEAGDIWRPEMEQAMQTGQTVRGNGLHPGAPGDVRPLAVPIKVRGQIVGVLDTYKPAEAGDWTPDEIALLEAIAGQLDAALEGARLYQDTQRRAAREKAIRHVTDEMRRAVDIETILQNTVTELANTLGARRAYVRLGTDLAPSPSGERDGVRGDLPLSHGDREGVSGDLPLSHGERDGVRGNP